MVPPKKFNLTYQDIYPNSKLSVKGVPITDPRIVLTPLNVQNLIKSFFLMERMPQWISTDHIELCHKVVVLYFEGIDFKRFQQNKFCLPTFQQISNNNFPFKVIANAQAGSIIPALYSFLGQEIHPKTMQIFHSFDEMILSERQLIENGFPVYPNPEILFSHILRCQQFGIQPLTSEECNNYRELPEPSNSNEKGIFPVIAIDCEMILTTLGNELARLSATNESGETVLDEFFKPIGSVVDLRFEFSGITQELLDSAKYNSKEGVDVLSKIANKNTIIVGHSLENDFRALYLIHYRAVDTSLIFNKDAPFPKKPSLQKLYAKYIKKDFRKDEAKGHDSAEDARASLELAQYAMKEAVHEISKMSGLPDLFKEDTGILKAIPSVLVVGSSQSVNFEGLSDRVHCIVCNSDIGIKETVGINYSIPSVQSSPKEPAESTKEKMNKKEADVKILEKKSITEVISQNIINNFKKDNPDQSPLVIGIFQAASKCSLLEEIFNFIAYDEALKKIIDNIPQDTAVIIYTGSGNMARLRAPGVNMGKPGYDPTRKVEFETVREGLLWIYSKN